MPDKVSEASGKSRVQSPTPCAPSSGDPISRLATKGLEAGVLLLHSAGSACSLDPPGQSVALEGGASDKLRRLQSAFLASKANFHVWVSEINFLFLLSGGLLCIQGFGFMLLMPNVASNIASWLAPMAASSFLANMFGICTVGNASANIVRHKCPHVCKTALVEKKCEATVVLWIFILHLCNSCKFHLWYFISTALSFAVPNLVLNWLPTG